MSNWNYTIGPAPVDTGSKLAQKWRNTTPVDYARLCNYQFVLPAFNLAIVSQQPGSYVIWQLNYSFPSAFSIFNFLDVIRQLPAITDGTGGQNTTFSAAIRYRVGNKITRYKLNDIPDQRLFAPLYNGEIILPNFSLEIYPIIGFVGGDTAANNDNAVTLISSIKYQPQPYPAAVGNSTQSPVSQAFGFLSGMNNELFVSLPITNPQPMNALGPFLSN